MLTHSDIISILGMEGIYRMKEIKMAELLNELNELNMQLNACKGVQRQLIYHRISIVKSKIRNIKDNS